MSMLTTASLLWLVGIILFVGLISAAYIEVNKNRDAGILRTLSSGYIRLLTIFLPLAFSLYLIFVSIVATLFFDMKSVGGESARVRLERGLTERAGNLSDDVESSINAPLPAQEEVLSKLI